MVRLRSPSTPSRVEGLILNSYAKLNLYLVVLNKRKDSYHNIKTIFERIDLADKIILKSRQDKKIKIICSVSDIPKDNLNLAYQTVRLLQESLNIDRGVDIKIIKRIPIGSGLGGGSSNAANVLVGLNKLWRLNLTQNKLVAFAKKIGSDVPFFIYNSPFAQGVARGDKVRPLKTLNNVQLWHILVVPKVKISTPLVYKKWDTDFKTSKISQKATLTPTPILRKKEYNKLVWGLTKPRYNVKMLKLALRKNDLSLIGKTLFNSLEQVTNKLYPGVRQIKEELINLGLKAILMSGSGPAVFGIVSSRKEAISLCRQLKKNRFWQVFVTRTR